MSVLIKGFVMPTKREDCPLCDYEEGVCLAWLNVKDDDEIRHCSQGVHQPKDRPEWCPLIELPDADEFAEKMRTERVKYDEEIAHSCMDYAMCELLKKLGYGEAVKIFDDAPKWYS